MSVTQTTVRIDSGEIAGTESGDVRAYLGVPYAAPPVGPLRWRAPQPVVAWTGVRDCTRFGPDPMQIPEPVPIRRTRATSYSEDCLNLNVWAPAHPPAGGAPVIVYFDFGGFIAGSASRERTDGSNYARRGVVCVNVNHRYGVFGFLAHPALSAESEHGVSGNYGFLDTIRALEWVRDNIAAFGGDPGHGHRRVGRRRDQHAAAHLAAGQGPRAPHALPQRERSAQTAHAGPSRGRRPRHRRRPRRAASDPGRRTAEDECGRRSGQPS
jgi:para-nitrobenzyl esterase